MALVSKTYIIYGEGVAVVKGLENQGRYCTLLTRGGVGYYM
jgi:hypothetical protein